MRLPIIAAIAAVVLISSPAAAQPANNAALRIVVVEGEDAVNIIQQKTAVAPIIEVRDVNNLPVSGATVTFSIGPGASFGGQSTLTVVTNAAGQATATGLTPSAAGAIQIQATATFQGQTAIATITQSNVLTAAEVAGTTAGGASGTGGTTGATTGAAGGGAGGMSATTIGIIAGAGVGGTLVATQAAGGGGDSSSATSTTPPGATSTAPPSTTTTPTNPTPPPANQQPSSASYSGPIDGRFTGTSTVTFPGEAAFNCTISLRNTGTATLRTQTTSNGSITGTLDMSGTQTPDISTCTGGVPFPLPPQPFAWTANVTGSGNAIQFTQEFRDSGAVAGAGSYTTTATLSFTGTISGGTVTGTVSWNATADIRVDGGGTSRATWTGTINLSLR